VESPNLTNTQCPFGVGAPKELGRGNLDLKDLRTAIKWSFVNVRGERKSWVWHKVDFIVGPSICSPTLQLSES